MKKIISSSPSPHCLTWRSHITHPNKTPALQAMVLRIGAMCSMYLHVETFHCSGNSQDRVKDRVRKAGNQTILQSQRTEGDIKQTKCVNKALVS